MKKVVFILSTILFFELTHAQKNPPATPLSPAIVHPLLKEPPPPTLPERPLFLKKKVSVKKVSAPVRGSRIEMERRPKREGLKRKARSQ